MSCRPVRKTCPKPDRMCFESQEAEAQAPPLCRYGGDEFVVILRRIGSTETILRKGQEICREFSGFRLREDFCGTCSGGIVLCGEDEKPSGKLIERADQALYRAKRENKGGCCLWEE